MVKRLLRKILPPAALQTYHLALAHLAAFRYGFPSRDMIVVGVTGTNGKSSTTSFLGQLLVAAGKHVGWTSTASFFVDGSEEVNATKMTMLGRFRTQAYLRRMKDAGCTYAIVETSSQGLSQYRHVGINYDVAVFTNLTPEHIEAHGGFEAYKKAKGVLFTHTRRGVHKILQGRCIRKIAVVHADDPHAPYFLGFGLEYQYAFGRNPKALEEASRIGHTTPLLVTDVVLTAQGSTFSVDGHPFSVSCPGDFQVQNIVTAIVTARALGIEWEVLQKGAKGLVAVPGRLESIREGQPFAVFVDYAYEPAALEAVMKAIALFPHKRLIQVTGSAGGGRDVVRRDQIGRLVGKGADLMIITNEDPYDDPPEQIVSDVAKGAYAVGKKEGETVFSILDRREAIRKALELAMPGDVVLVAGKGSEPVMAVEGGKLIPWDDREVVREELRRRSLTKT